MKIRTPYTRHDLQISKKDNVVEVGSGHNPFYRANVIVEKFIDNNYHRSGDIKIYPHQKFVNADGENLPFKDKEFDYIICNQVLEHSENPVQFIKEHCRVAKRGYIETPSLLGEFLFPKKSHRWAILAIDNKLVLFDKSQMPEFKLDFGVLFLDYLPYQSLTYKILQLAEPQLAVNRYEWKDNIDFIVNPTDEYYKSFFTQPWNREMVEILFPHSNISKEFGKLIKGIWYLIKYEMRKLASHRKPLTLEEYKQLKNIPKF
ncbi:class I SAM-dependent methyltransferase [Bacteroides stercorirosoris]|uniref:SAM-dependent methyltransferase n=1 Tax=Bacteroides stercorirosoris TaxID=871324 RepID=A0A413H6S8_9BACE|nr:class I SAM-dependent methyltransferase [Bacteroides stercorirosoris]RGX79340.1 SAM-dependent methyltransferase [Bacteroides stercorirosoris]